MDGAALVVMDANTREAAGARVAAVLGEADELVFNQRAGLRPGLEEVTAVRGRLRPGITPVAVGSGVITDIVRYAAHLSDIDFVSVPTAASMDGYASGVAAMEVDGVKVTYPARPPVAILADPGVLAAAPPELTRAGIGDLLGKATAQVDWLAAHLLYGESYDEGIAERVQGVLRETTAGAGRALAGEADALRALLAGLVQSGRAIALAGSSRPASGCEHHASHFWDLLAAQGRRPHTLHGLQVGYATRYAMRLQRFAYAGGVPALRRPAPAADPLGSAAREWLGQPTAEIVAAVEEKRRWAATIGPRWPEDERRWREVCATLAAAMQPFPAVERALAVAEIPDGPGFLDIGAATLAATFRHATRLRARYTVVDFLEGQAMLDAALAVALPAGCGVTSGPPPGPPGPPPGQL